MPTYTHTAAHCHGATFNCRRCSAQQFAAWHVPRHGCNIFYKWHIGGQICVVSIWRIHFFWRIKPLRLIMSFVIDLRNAWTFTYIDTNNWLSTRRRGRAYVVTVNMLLCAITILARSHDAHVQQHVIHVNGSSRVRRVWKDVSNIVKWTNYVGDNDIMF